MEAGQQQVDGGKVVLPIGQLAMIVDQLQRRNSDLIAHISHNQTSRDPAKLNENVRLLRELDLNLHKVHVPSYDGTSSFNLSKI
jgi:hypothetical protein